MTLFIVLGSKNSINRQPLAGFEKRTAPTIISVYNFSGRKGNTKDYKPGSNGENLAKPDKPHYRVEIDVMSGFAKQEMIEKIGNVQQLDGTGNLYLILQVKSASKEGLSICCVLYALTWYL